MVLCNGNGLARVLTGQKTKREIDGLVQSGPGAPPKLRRDRGEELGRRTRGAGEKIVAVEHFVGRDRFDLDGCNPEVQDRDAILSARAATEPDDETRRLGHHCRDVTTAVVLPAAAAGDLLKMTDQLIDPAHAHGIRTSRASPLASFALRNGQA